MASYEKMFRKSEKNDVDVVEETIDVELTEDVYPVQEEKTGIVANCQAAYVREGPSMNEKHKTVVKSGEHLLVYGSEDGWYKVITDSGYDGYIRSDLVKVD